MYKQYDLSSGLQFTKIKYGCHHRVRTKIKTMIFSLNVNVKI